MTLVGWFVSKNKASRQKSLRQVAMVAKFLDDSKPKTSLGKWIRPISNFIDLIQFHSICWMLAKFSGVESEKTAYEFRKRKRIFLCCVYHANSIERAREIRKFHVAVRLVHGNQNSHTTTGWAESVSTDEKLLKALVTAIKKHGVLSNQVSMHASANFTSFEGLGKNAKIASSGRKNWVAKMADVEFTQVCNS